MRLGWTVLARSSGFGDDDDHDNDRDNDDDDDDNDVVLARWSGLGDDDHHHHNHDDDDDDNNDVGLCKVEWIVIGSSFHTLSLPNVLARYPEVTEIV